MSNIAFDFLTESFMFKEYYIDNNYQTVSDKELSNELSKYREHIIQNFDDIISEISTSHDATNVAIETFNMRPDESKLKQLALYMNQIIIGDPLFAETEGKGDSHEPMSKFLGVNFNEEIDRERISKAAQYMKNSTFLVYSQFIKFLPVSLLNEAPKDLPIVYSETNFSDVFPRELYELFHKHAKVSNVKRTDGTMIISPSDKLSLGTMIHVDFGLESLFKGMIYQFTNSVVEKADPKTNKLTFRYYIPDTICKSDFDAWIENSINRASIKFYNDTFNELNFAKQVNCMYLTESPFSAQLLKTSISNHSIESDIANLSMELELPIFTQLPLKEIISIRNNYGEAFYNFRKGLDQKLVTLRGITDYGELKKSLENISYELTELQIHNVNKEHKKILRSLGFDLLLLTGTLTTSFLTGGLTMLGAAGAVAKGGNDYLKYYSQAKENDGFFLWKLNQTSKKL